MKNQNNNLGCGIALKRNNNGDKQNSSPGKCDFMCGIPNAWGTETFCQDCNQKMKAKWDKEDRTSKDPRIREIYKLKKKWKLNY